MCSQQVLLQAAYETQGSKKMNKLEVAFGYMYMIRDLGEAKEFRQCMGLEGWPLESLV